VRDVVELLQKHGHIHGRTQRFRTKTGQIRDHVLWAEVITLNGAEICAGDGHGHHGTETAGGSAAASAEAGSLGHARRRYRHDFNNILGAIISFAELCKWTT